MGMGQYASVEVYPQCAAHGVQECPHKVRQWVLSLAYNGPTERPTPPVLPEAQWRFIELLCHPANYNYRQIAAFMSVKLSTIHTHRRLFQRFEINNKLALVLLGRSWGLGGAV